MSEREKLVEVIRGAIYATHLSHGMDSQAEAAHVLAALEAAGVRLVPVEATAGMTIAAIVRPHQKLSTTKTGDMYSDIYRAMLAASPYNAKDPGNG